MRTVHTTVPRRTHLTPRPRRAGVALALLGAAALACSGEEQPAPAAPPSTPPAAPPPASAVPSTPEPAAPPAAAGAASDAPVDGAAVFAQYCVACHGPTGKGDGPTAVALDPKPRDFSVGDFQFDPNGNGQKGELEDIMAVARDGAAKYGGSPFMAPLGLNEAQLKAVAEYVKSLKGS